MLQSKSCGLVFSSTICLVRVCCSCVSVCWYPGDFRRRQVFHRSWACRGWVGLLVSNIHYDFAGFFNGDFGCRSNCLRIFPNNFPRNCRNFCQPSVFSAYRGLQYPQRMPPLPNHQSNLTFYQSNHVKLATINFLSFHGEVLWMDNSSGHQCSHELCKKSNWKKIKLLDRKLCHRRS